MLDFMKLDKKKSNTIITQAYDSRCSFWNLSSKVRIAFNFSTLLSSKVNNENDAKSDFRL